MKPLGHCCKPAPSGSPAQEKVDIGEGGALSFTVDLVLYDIGSGEACCVLDTKYKATDKPAPDDVTQVVAYAEMMGCRRAILIYPVPLAQPVNQPVGNIRVQSRTFSLDGDLEEAGQAFLQSVFSDQISIWG